MVLGHVAIIFFNRASRKAGDFLLPPLGEGRDGGQRRIQIRSPGIQR